MRRMIALLLLIVIMLSLHGCFLDAVLDDVILVGRKEKLNNQMGIENPWRSEDGKIQFTMQSVVIKEVHSDGKEFMVRTTRGVGTMETDNGCIDIWIHTWWDYDSNKSEHGGFIIQLAPEDEYGPKITLESGLRGPLEDGKITVTFTATTYLEENAVITFYYVDE